MGEEPDWEALAEELGARPMPASAKINNKSPKAPSVKKEYKAGYDATKLQKLLARRGEENAGQLAQQRGRTLVTSKRSDQKRAQSATQSTFDGHAVVNNLVGFDKNQINIPENYSMAAQFGNFQEAAVHAEMAKGHKHAYKLYSKCPI